MNKRVLESLIQCGAFDSTGFYRSQMMACVEDALDYGQKIQKEAADPQMHLFGGSSGQEQLNPPTMPDISEWDEKQKLSLEKEAIGFYITGHPLDEYQDLLEKFASTNSLDLMDEGVKDGAVVRIGGIIRSIKTITTKRGDPMAFVELEDIHGSVEVVVFTRVYTQVNDFLLTDTPVFVQGEIQKNEKSVKILAESIVPINKAEETLTASVHMTLDAGRTDQRILDDLYQLLKNYPGKCEGFLHVVIPGKTETIIELPRQMRLRAGMSLTNEVNRLLGYQSVTTHCSPIKSSPQITENSGKKFVRGRK